ncbi:MAG: hypothetical protein NC123_20245 [Butyrivibrio sp.]|nr:hypothetical protein [Butyrivibrio sp.]
MRGQRATKIYKTFDEWLVNRMDMTEQELRNALEKNLPYYHYELERPDAVIACYKRKYREETDILASENIDLTFLEWLQIYKHHTPASFHEMCAGTGVSPREETIWMDSLKRQWEERHERFISDSNPFEQED